MMEGRHVGARGFPAESDGALDSTQIQALIDAKRPQFNAFAAALRDAGMVALRAADAKDAQALMKAGGGMEAVCEACHVTFWYPNQVIPAFPAQDGAKTPIRRLGTAPEKSHH
jgi:cytochrome c556